MCYVKKILKKIFFEHIPVLIQKWCNILICFKVIKVDIQKCKKCKKEMLNSKTINY